jgi:hypothetical protein
VSCLTLSAQSDVKEYISSFVGILVFSKTGERLRQFSDCNFLNRPSSHASTCNLYCIVLLTVARQFG